MAARVAAHIVACVWSVQTALAPLRASAHTSVPAAVVPSAYEDAANTAGIPSHLLWAVALQESGWTRGSRFVPWPWTLDLAGRPARFATRERACQALHRALTHISPTRIDVGLTQVNWGYHREVEHNPCELLEESEIDDSSEPDVPCMGCKPVPL